MNSSVLHRGQLATEHHFPNMEGFLCLHCKHWFSFRLILPQAWSSGTQCRDQSLRTISNTRYHMWENEGSETVYGGDIENGQRAVFLFFLSLRTTEVSLRSDTPAGINPLCPFWALADIEVTRSWLKHLRKVFSAFPALAPCQPNSLSHHRAVHELTIHQASQWTTQAVHLAAYVVQGANFQMNSTTHLMGDRVRAAAGH